MNDLVLLMSVGTIVLLILLTTVFRNRSSRLDYLVEDLRALSFKRLHELFLEHRRRLNESDSSSHIGRRSFATLSTAALRAELAHEADSVDGQLSSFLNTHAKEVAQLDKPFEEVLADIVRNDPYVRPLLLTRFDQAAAEAYHHQRCRDRASVWVTRNEQVLRHIRLLQDLVRDAKADLNRDRS